jgi:outer membrane lipoprotein LolB
MAPCLYGLPRVATMLCALLLGACVATRPPTRAAAPAPWALRLPVLQQANHWGLEGRAAAAVGAQGWQASMAWRQQGPSTEVHLAGPLGVGASVLRLTSDGLSIDGAAPRSDVLEQLHGRLGFDLPLSRLRYWLLGVPDPGAAYEITRNDSDRVRQLTQAGWTVDFDRYLPVDGDWLPGQLVLHREDVRVRIAVEHWDSFQ